MTRYSVLHRYYVFLKAYGFLSFAKNMSKKISKKLSRKHCQKLLDHAKQSATNPRKITSKRLTQKTAEATGNLIGSKIANTMTKISITSPQNDSETIVNE